MMVAQVALWLLGVVLAPSDDLAALLATPGPAQAQALVAGGDAVAPQIAEALRANSNASPLTAWALAQHPVPEARAALEAALGSSDQRTGYWAAFALGALGDERSADALAAILPPPDEPKAYWELAYWTPDRWVSMYERKYDSAGNVTIPEAPEGTANIRVAHAALCALGRIGGQRAAQTLTGMLRCAQWLMRCGAAQGLGEMRCAAAAPQLTDLARHDPTLVVRRAAQDALGAIERGPRQAPERPALQVPAIAFIKARARTESSLGFQDSYPFPKMPWYHWGENIYTLTPPGPNGVLRNITGFENRRVQGLEASYDATKLVFSMCDDTSESGFHVCEIGVDGAGFRQLTSGNCNDVDPYYLPDGRIVFASDRAGHQEYYHQERSTAIYVMDPDGSDIRRLTFNPNQDYDPLVLSDGRLAYTSYRFYGQDGSGDVYLRGSDLNRIETQLRVMNPDGTGDNVLYGAQRGGFYVPVRPMADSLQDSGASYVRGGQDHIGSSVSWVRDLPGGQLICVTPAGLTLVDLSEPARGCEAPFFPEVLNLAGGEEVYIYSHDELNPVGRYTSPYPADDGRLFLSYAPWWDTSFSAYGIYLFDMETRALELVYDDPAVSDVDPIALVPRPAPALALPDTPARDGQATGRILCLSAFNSDIEYERSAARYVRVLGATLMGLSVNANAAFESHVLGTVPLQPDGSFLVEVPADRPVRFELLGEDGNVLLHETEFNYVRGGETVTCFGCHEGKGSSPPQAQPLAAGLPAYPTLETVGNLRYHGRVQRGYNWLARE